MLSGQRSRTSTQNFASNCCAIRRAAETKNKCGVEAIMRSGLPNCFAIAGAHQAKSGPKGKIVPQPAKATVAVARGLEKPEIDIADALRSRLLEVLGEDGEILRSRPAADAPSWSRHLPAKTAANGAQARVLRQTDATARYSCRCPATRNFVI